MLKHKATLIKIVVLITISIVVLTG